MIERYREKFDLGAMPGFMSGLKDNPLEIEHLENIYC